MFVWTMQKVLDRLMGGWGIGKQRANSGMDLEKGASLGVLFQRICWDLTEVCNLFASSLIYSALL